MARITPTAQQPPRTPRHDFGKKVRTHTRYYLESGQQVPGVTSIVGVLDKPALPAWANRMGLQGIQTGKYTDEAASIGSLAHHLIESELLDVEPQLGDYTQNQIERVQRSLHHFHQWVAQHRLEPQLVEAVLISEVERYGGTIDFYGSVDGIPTLVDYKTSGGGIWREHKIQVLGGYWGLLKENGYPVKGIRILRFPYGETDELEEYVASGQKALHCWRIFKLLRALYEELKGL